METLLSLSSLSSPLKFAVRASWDTKQRLPYNPNAPRKLKKNTVPIPTPISPAPIIRKRDQYISDLLKRATPLPTIGICVLNSSSSVLPIVFNFYAPK